MKPRHRALPSACLALLMAMSPRWVLAAERTCPAVTIEPNAAFRELHPSLLARIQKELAARSDIDACAHVELLLLDEAVINVSVTLPDGRTASRNVARSEEVIPTLEGLLLVPDKAPVTVSPEPPPAQPAVPSRATAILTLHTNRDSVVAPTPATVRPRTLGIELSVIAGGRVGDGQFGYGAGVLSFLEVKHWLVGFEGRADGYRSLQGGDPETALELAFLAGRRLDFGSVALDLTAGPGVALEGVSFSQTEAVRVGSMSSGVMAARASEPEEPRSGAMPRLLVGARLGFNPRSLFRTFVGIDGELGPMQASDPSYLAMSSPRMPAYTVGLAVGATVGTR